MSGAVARPQPGGLPVWVVCADGTCCHATPFGAIGEADDFANSEHEGCGGRPHSLVDAAGLGIATSEPGQVAPEPMTNEPDGGNVPMEITYSESEPIEAVVDGTPGVCRVERGVPERWGDATPVLRITLPDGRWVQFEGPELEWHIEDLWQTSRPASLVEWVAYARYHLGRLLWGSRGDGEGDG
jgi:hypothetical protein